MALILALVSLTCPSEMPLQANVQDAEFFSLPRGAEIGLVVQLCRHYREGAGIWTLRRSTSCSKFKNKPNAQNTPSTSPFVVSPRIGSGF